MDEEGAVIMAIDGKRDIGVHGIKSGSSIGVVMHENATAARKHVPVILHDNRLKEGIMTQAPDIPMAMLWVASPVEAADATAATVVTKTSSNHHELSKTTRDHLHAEIQCQMNRPATASNRVTTISAACMLASGCLKYWSRSTSNDSADERR